MSKPRIKVSAIIDTEAHADTIISNIQTELSGKDVFEQHALNKFINQSGQIELVFEARFNNQIDRNDIKDWIKDRIQNHPQVKNWVLSAKISDHLCTHDDKEVKDCRTTEYEELVK